MASDRALKAASAHSEDAEANFQRRIERMPNAAEARVHLAVALKNAYIFRIQGQFDELLTAIGSRDLTHHATATQLMIG